MRLARLRLALLRAWREQPLLCVLCAGLSALLLVTEGAAWGCASRSDAAPNLVGVRSDSSSTAGAAVHTAHDGKLSMSEVVVGIMTCMRFHSTRCRMQRDTWLRRARRVVFYSDGTADSAELNAPLVVHEFEPSPTERVFSGGNWRALPILRSLGEAFFTSAAQEAMRRRDEPPPKWAYMADDDSYAFTPQLLDTLSQLDPDKPHYLGYAFIAAPHLEGVIPGKRQPKFANGGAGIAVSRGAFAAALPLFDGCERAYRWDWPGDVRVAQCLLDAGVP